MLGATKVHDPHAPDGWDKVRGAEVLTDGTRIVILGDPSTDHHCDSMGCSSLFHVLLPEHELPSDVRESDPAPLMSIVQMVRTLHTHLYARAQEARQASQAEGSPLDAAVEANIDNALGHLHDARQDLRDAIRGIYKEEDVDQFVTELLGDEEAGGDGGG